MGRCVLAITISFDLQSIPPLSSILYGQIHKHYRHPFHKYILNNVDIPRVNSISSIFLRMVFMNAINYITYKSPGTQHPVPETVPGN